MIDKSPYIGGYKKMVQNMLDGIEMQLDADYLEYRGLAELEKNVIFGGRLGEYKQYDMAQVILAAIERGKAELK